MQKKRKKFKGKSEVTKNAHKLICYEREFTSPQPKRSKPEAHVYSYPISLVS